MGLPISFEGGQAERLRVRSASRRREVEDLEYLKWSYLYSPSRSLRLCVNPLLHDLQLIPQPPELDHLQPRMANKHLRLNFYGDFVLIV